MMKKASVLVLLVFIFSALSPAGVWAANAGLESTETNFSHVSEVQNTGNTDTVEENPDKNHIGEQTESDFMLPSKNNIPSDAEYIEEYFPASDTGVIDEGSIVSQDSGVHIKYISCMPKGLNLTTNSGTSHQPTSSVPTGKGTLPEIIPNDNSDIEIEEDNTYRPLLACPQSDDQKIAPGNPLELVNDAETSSNLTIDQDVKEITSSNPSPEAFPIKSKGTSYKAGFSGQSGGDLLQFSVGDASLIVTPEKTASSSGRVDQNSITYTNIFENTDLRYTIGDSFIKEEIILNKPGAKEEYSFRLNAGKVQSVLSDGMILFLDPESQQPLFYMPRPFAVDSQGRHCDEVKYNLDESGQRLTVDIDPVWLAEAAYPVIIDPSIFMTGREIICASANFSDTQGKNNWYYMEQRSTGYFYYMTWDAANNRWQDINNTAFVGANWQKPGANNVARTWKVPQIGYVAIRGNVRKMDTGGGDGVKVKILVDDTQLWPTSGWQNIAYNDNIGVNVNLNTKVYQNQEIRFLVNQNSNNTNDTIAWDPTISYINDSYQALSGFSNTQGQGNWYYDEQKPDNSYANMTWDSGSSQWKDSTGQGFITGNSHKPSTSNAVRTWKAPHSGIVSVSSQIYKKDTAGGDGVKVKILRNGNQVWPASGWQSIAYNNSKGVYENIDIPVIGGDIIRFVMNKNSTTTNDETYWDPLISYYSVYGTGVENYWNYLNQSLGDGWNTSVNTANLNMILTKGLFTIPGRGISIGDSLTYNSIDSRAGILGPGWHMGSETSLLERPDGSVEYNQGDGSCHVFIKQSGSYWAPYGVFLKLDKDAQGNFTITDARQNVMTYVNGKPSQIVDRDGNTTTFAYNAQGQLSQMSDPSGRAIGYTYAGNNLSGITDPAGRSYLFSYQNNRLATITDPMNNVVIFTYNTNGCLDTFTDPLNRVTTYTYLNEKGQNQSIKDARSTAQDVYETVFAQNMQNNQLVTTVTDPAGHAWIYTHEPSSGCMTQAQDPLGNTWNYVWSSNQLNSAQDAKGTTSYQYNPWGLVTQVTRTIDGTTNIVNQISYDANNNVIFTKDGEDKVTEYQYDIRGDLLSTGNPDVKESNGKKYDQYGNVIESSPRVSASYNLLKNGSMEVPNDSTVIANWTKSYCDGCLTLQDATYHPFGQKSLKIQGYSPGDGALFYQPVGNVANGDKLTLSADVKLVNVQPYGSSGGAFIKIKYSNNYEEQILAWGDGTFPLVLTSQAASRGDARVYIGFFNASGQAFFDGVQLENNYSTGEYYRISEFNLVENSSFENNLDNWTVTNSYSYNVPYGGSKSLCMDRNTSAYQDVPIFEGASYTLSGMILPYQVDNNGAYYRVDFLDASDQYIAGSTFVTGKVMGTKDRFARLSTIVTAPTGARKARIWAVNDGDFSTSNYSCFDNIKLIPRNSSKYTFDSSGNYCITAEDPLGNTTHSTYTANTGTVSSVSDALNNTASFTYDGLNRLTQVNDPLNHNSYYEYDPMSYLIKTRDPRSSGSTDNTYRSSYTPNNINLLSSFYDPLNRTTSNTYDRAGNLTLVNLPNGRSVSYSYDDANRLTQRTLSTGETYGYSYDGANNLTGVTQGGQTWSWDYDGAGRLKYSIDSFGKRIDYTWDKSNNLTQMSGLDNYGITYVYGKDNRLLQAADKSYHYDENGRVFKTVAPDNIQSISYYPNGWCQNIRDSKFPGQYDFKYNYYSNGNISSINSWVGTENFIYDGMGRITNWSLTPRSGNAIQNTYSYDAAGNLLTKGATSYTYNAANQITSAGFTYDNNGNLTADGTYRYTYNAENQLIEVRRAADNSLVASYTYNFNGLRKSKTVNGVTTNFYYDKNGNLVKDSNNSFYYYDPNGKLLSLITGGYYYAVHSNARGDVVSIVGNNATTQYQYDPWGKIISTSGPANQPFRYAGYYYDEETGLYYLKSRYYSPTLGRFLTTDARSYINVGNPQTLNLYSYCNNNPINFVDPSGCDYRGYDEYGFDDDEIDYTDEEKSQLNEIGYCWNNGGDKAALHNEALAIREGAIDRMLAEEAVTAVLGCQWHTDRSLQTGEKFIDMQGYRFNSKGQLVDHPGRVIESKPTGAAAKVLQYLKNVKPDFFECTPVIIVVPQDLYDLFGLPKPV